VSDAPILLVDDHADDEELALLALRELGVHRPVVVARDGVEALERLFGSVEATGPLQLRPVLILLDLKLPRLDGFAVLERVRANPQGRTLPVVVLSTSDAPEDVDRSYALGANSYVCKPVGFDAFAEAVRSIAQYWLGWNARPPGTAGL
jgi:CheY-like chemotaxis protein